MRKLVVLSLIMMLLAGQNIALLALSYPSNVASIASSFLVDWNHYHNYSEIVATLFHLNTTYSSLVQVFSIGKSWQNRDVYAVKLTNKNVSRQKVQVLFVGYHHARERITSELALYFLVYATANYANNQTIARMLDYCEIYVIVSLNVDGFDAVQQNEWQRKNVHPIDEDQDGLFDEDSPDDEDEDGYIEDLIRRNGSESVFIKWEGIDSDGDNLRNEDSTGGVDLNRNYGHQWNASVDSGSPYPSDEDYRGPAAFSEPETQAIRDFALQHDFKYAVSLHSGSELILYPWCYSRETTPHNRIFTEIASNLSTLVNAPYKQSGIWYTTSGSWEDWFYSNRSTFALTCEVYANLSAWRYEPGPYPNTYWESGITQAFNPSPNEIQTVIRRWLPVFTYMTNRSINEAYDLIITNVTCDRTIIGQDYPMNLTAVITIRNNGFFRETSEITIRVNTIHIASETISLVSGESLIVTTTLDGSLLARALGTYDLGVQIAPVAGETYAADNSWNEKTIRVTISGDINGDFNVERSDLVILAQTYNSEPGDPNWDYNADVDGNGTVGLSDLVALATHYGQHCP